MRAERSFFGRFLRMLALTAGSLVVAAIAAFVVAGPRQSLAFLLRQGLTLAGYGPVALEVTRADGTGITVERFAAGRGGALTIAKAALDFKDGGPLAGAKGLVLDGVVYAASLGPSGFDSGFALRPARGGAPSLALPKLPFPVIVNDSRGRVATPYGLFDAVSSLAARFEGGALVSAYDLSFVPQGGAIGAHKGALTLKSDAAGALDLVLNFAPGAARAGTGAGAGAAAAVPAAPVTGVPKKGVFYLTVTAKGNPQTGPFDARADLKDVDIPALDLRLGHAFLTAARARESAAFALAAGLDSAAAKGAVLTNFTAQGTLAQEPQGLTLRMSECASLETARYGLGAMAVTARLPKLCAAAAGGALARIGDGAWDYGLHATGGSIAYGPAGRTAALEGTLPEIYLTGASAAAGWSVTLKGDGGNIHAPSGVVFNDIALEGDIAGGRGNAARGKFAIRHALLSDFSAAARFSPLTLTGGAALADGTVDFSLSGAMPGIETLARFEGRHALATGLGEAAFEIPDLVFAEGGVTPQMLSPALRGAVGAATGTLSAEGRFAWDNAGMTSKGTFKVADLGGHLAFGKIEGMNGTIAFASLAPLRTDGAQTLTVALIDAGLPLPRGVITFRVEPAARLVVQNAQWPLLGGTVGLSSAVFDLAQTGHQATLAVDKVDLAQLLAMADIDGLSGTGTLTGRIPLRLEGAHQYIEGGTLAAEKPGGTLIYKGASADAAVNAGDQSKILFQALDNFRYESLDAALNGDVSDALSLKVHLKGNNPALYNGYPIELNVATEGPFVSMLKKSLYAVKDAAHP